MKSSILIPVLAGAAVAGALAYFLISDDTEEWRNDLSDLIDKGLDMMKDRLGNKIDPIADEVSETV
ncbi:MAG TPA: hypothetical protein VGM63_23405 [Mucilaginibacter sp.]|jgi:hypothetical protein